MNNERENSNGDQYLEALKETLQRISQRSLIPELSLLELCIDNAKNAYHEEINQLEAIVDSHELI